MKPLFFPDSVQDKDNFFGRSEILEELAGGFPNDWNRPRLIVGGRRIGKTSLLNILSRRLSAEATRQEGKPAAIHNIATLSISNSNSNSLDSFTNAISRSLAGSLGESATLNGRATQSADAFLESLHDLATRLPGWHFLLVIDEFDEVIRVTDMDDTRLHRTHPELSQILKIIDTLSNQRSDLPFTLLFSMTEIPQSLIFKYPSSFLNRSIRIELGPLSEKENCEMVTGILGNDLSCSEQALNWFYALSGGIPYITKLLLEYAIKKTARQGRSSISPAVMTDCLQEATQDPRASFALNNIYKVHLTNDEKKLLLLMAFQHGPVTHQQLQKGGPALYKAAEKLARRFYVNLNAQGCVLRVGFWAEWLNNWIEFDEEMDILNIASLTHVIS